MKITKIIVSAFLLLLLPMVARAQSYIKTINDGWTFSKDQVHWTPVALPHTWNTDAYSTRDYKQGKYFYKRTLRLPSAVSAEQSGQTILSNNRYFLKLEAASKTSTIYINGQEVGTHRGGYTASVCDVTPYIIQVASQSTSQSNGKVSAPAVEILVSVDNADGHVAPLSADFTFMGGIYRNVKLITTGQQHFSMVEDGSDGVFVKINHVDAGKAQIGVNYRLRNDAKQSKDCYVVNTVYAPNGAIVSSTKKRIKLLGQQTLSSEMALPLVKQPELWSPEHPVLYRVKTELLDASKKQVVLDSQEHSIGLRWCEFDAAKGFFLNGKPYKLNGMCRHQDQYPYGVALEDDMHRQDVRLMKEMGCNFVRLAHYPQAEAVLEECDKLGLLVWEEIPIVNYVPDDETFAENACQQLREMIRQHYNHPSVILWGYMNEILLKARNEFPGQEAFDKELKLINSLAARLENIVHEEDATRTSTMALHGSDDYNKLGVANHSQVLGWNLYQGWYGGDLSGFERYLAQQNQKHPTHPVIVSEWGAGSDLRIHSDHGKAFDFSCEYQQKYIEHYLPVISDTPYILGGSYWNFVDFSSASRAESMPHINNKGILTADRKKKDVFYYFQAAWRKDISVLHIATRDWPCRVLTDTQQPVKVYTNAKEVCLYHNGKSLGTKPVNNHFALFEVEWTDGENRLEATATDAQKQTVKDETVVNCQQIPTDASLLTDVAINVGSQCYFQSDKSGVTWIPDCAYEKGSWGYVGGKSVQTQSEIACTDDGPLYQTMREGIEAYRFDVPKGRYELEMLFTDIHQKQAKSIYLLGKDDNSTDASSQFNHFDVMVNGKVVESDFMPGAEAGFFSAIRRSYQIEANDDGIVIKYVNRSGKTFISAIRLRKVTL